MKILPLLFCVAAVSLCSAQSGEFATTNNGLIYSDNAIKELKHIVDSLNLKFKTCDNKAYYTNMQSKGTYFSIIGKNAAKAKKDIEAGIKPEKLLKKYPEAIVNNDLLIVRYSYKDYQDTDVISFESIGLNESDDSSISFSGKKAYQVKSIKKGWIYNFDKKSEYNDDSVYGFFVEGLSSVKLNDKYARLVQYSDCLVDTTATVYLDKAKKTGVRYGNDGVKIRALQEYLDKKLQRPIYSYDETTEIIADTLDEEITDTTDYYFDDKKYEEYAKRLNQWESTRFTRVDSLMQNDDQFKIMYKDALSAAIDGTETTNDEFEEYISRYTSKEQALYFKRNRRVIGGCSMDNSPRIHAMNIAELAAETAKWEIFLRSHLDIMNDRFDRVSDGSYAFGARKTYIKELEVLDINVNDLLLGISLRVENASKNHYFGSIGRMGRSLSEAKDRATIEKAMLDMIADNELDDFNRVLFYWLFRNYNHNLENKDSIVQNNIKLREAVAYMPAYLSKDAKIKD